ncbi:carbohydrate binding domain-containing protein [Marinomonas sp. 2405UD66-6]|uniref:carbohydrate binding domain-containing protein n=1 Tax=Marinomonas sp. 2405UD66-6 TaxID=3391834 RepID=UPI0039C8D3E4
MTLLKTLMTTAVCTIAISAAQAASVPIENASFEQKWSSWEDTDPSAISGEAYEGSKSAKLEGAGAKAAQVVSVQEDTDYVLTAWVKGKGTIGVTAGANTKTANVDSSGWQQATVTFNSGSSSSVTIFGAYNGGKGRFDAFSLESK